MKMMRSSLKKIEESVLEGFNPSKKREIYEK
jgi:hypothetical protein